MSVSQLQYILIFFQIFCRDFTSIHTLARQQLPQSGRPSKFFSLNRDIGITSTVESIILNESPFS